MDERLTRLYSRWHDADGADRDDEADEAFRALTEEVIPATAVSPLFSERTMQAIAEATTAEARRVALTRKVLVVAAIAVTVAAGFAAPFALSVASNALIAGLNGIIA